MSLTIGRCVREAAEAIHWGAKVNWCVVDLEGGPGPPPSGGGLGPPPSGGSRGRAGTAPQWQIQREGRDLPQ